MTNACPRVYLEKQGINSTLMYLAGYTEHKEKDTLHYKICESIMQQISTHHFGTELINKSAPQKISIY